jgi:hypothetical protein
MIVYSKYEVSNIIVMLMLQMGGCTLVQSWRSMGCAHSLGRHWGHYSSRVGASSSVPTHPCFT